MELQEMADIIGNTYRIAANPHLHFNATIEAYVEMQLYLRGYTFGEEVVKVLNNSTHIFEIEIFVKRQQLPFKVLSNDISLLISHVKSCKDIHEIHSDISNPLILSANYRNSQTRPVGGLRRVDDTPRYLNAKKIK